MACVTRHAALMSVSLASWRSCAKMRSSWTHWKSGTASSARRCDTSCMGDNFSHHCACNLVDHSHGLKVFPLHGCALVQLPDLGLTPCLIAGDAAGTRQSKIAGPPQP